MEYLNISRPLMDLTVARKILVLDLHIFYDNRINKHIQVARQRYEVFRINVNFFHGRIVENGQGYPAHIVTYAPTRNQYLNGLIFTLSVMTGRLTRRLHKMLTEQFVQDGDELIIHVHDPYLLGVAMGLRRKLKGASVVFDRHDHFETWKNRLGLSIPGFFENRYGSEVRELIIANPGTEHLPEAFSGKKVTQIPNFPLSEYFDREAVDRKAQRLVSDGEIDLAYFGALSLDFDRDIDLMLRLMAALMREHPKVGCTVAGRIFEQGVVGRLDGMRKEFGERFRYLGELPYKEVIESSKKAHIGFFLLNPDKPMWSPSRPYSANKIYEYLQTGTIPVVRAIIEEPDGIRDCSIFFDESATFDMMLGTLRDLCGDPKRMKDLMIRCYEVGLEYSWEKVAPRYLECYARIFGDDDRSV